MKCWVWCSVLMVVLGVWPTIAAAEGIESFVAEYHIAADATVRVTEVITYDFGMESKHGIFRTLQTNHADAASSWYKQRYVDYGDIVVFRNAEPEPFVTSGSRELEIKIGDPDRTISGRHQYTIIYTMTGAMTYFADETAELYWNVTGDAWPVPLASTAVLVTSDVPIGAVACYAGTAAAPRDCNYTASSSVTGGMLSVGEELTIAVAVPTVLPVVILEQVNVVPWLVGVWLLLAGALGVQVYRFRRRFYRPTTIIAEYEPYQNIGPMYAGVVLDDRLDARDIAAGIMYLAAEGFFKIKQTERKVAWLFDVTDYEVTLLRPLSDIPTTFLREVSLLLFAEGVVAPTTVALSSIKKDKKRLARNGVRLVLLQAALRADLVGAGYMQEKAIPTYRIAYWSAPLVFLVFAFDTVVQYVSAPYVMFGAGVLMLLIVRDSLMVRRRTEQGYAAMRHLQGFKEFLSVTDAERFAFHNAPSKSPEQFMQYLPYAVAFGVEDAWAQVFADMEITAPAWYEGSQAGTAFAASVLVHDITAFSSAVTASTRASAGGGSAGGGGGGGGGGSW